MAVRQLVELVGQQQPVDLAKASGLRTAAGERAQLKCIAHQSMAMLMIRNQQFSDAWKQLAAVDGMIAETSLGVRLQQSKLKLWLLVEAKDPNADEQLKTLVRQVIDPEMKENDRQDVCAFLGKLLFILDSSEGPCGVSKATTDRARLVLETQSSKNSVATFEMPGKNRKQPIANCARYGIDAPIKPPLNEW